ncbi:unnamed protein product, partial [Amoebophrya sp. A120]|eukprot:GSA120T00000553001.1
MSAAAPAAKAGSERGRGGLRGGTWATARSTKSFFYPSALKKEKESLLHSIFHPGGSTSSGRDSRSSNRSSSSFRTQRSTSSA